MALEDDRVKWNARYAESAAARPPAPHPLALRWRGRMTGGRMLDAACGLGRGIAAAGHLFHTIFAVDLSEVAVAQARRLWAGRNIQWTVGDVGAMAWEADSLGLACAFGFTDLACFRRLRAAMRPGGMFLYEGFSPRQREVHAGLDPAWTASPGDLMEILPGWTVLEQGESTDPPYRTRFAAVRPLSG